MLDPAGVYNTPYQKLIKEAASHGIVPGAECMDIIDHIPFKVSPSDQWTYGNQGGIYNGTGHHIRTARMNGNFWAKVITLQEGDAVECGFEMALAILVKAKKLGFIIYKNDNPLYTAIVYRNGVIIQVLPLHFKGQIKKDYEFLQLMEETAKSFPKSINGHKVKVFPDSIELDGIVYSRDTFNKIMAL